MTDQKPTGVFVRLPLISDDIQRMDRAMSQNLEAHAKPTLESASEAALLAIGTPVAGGELDEIGLEVVHAHGSNLTYCRNHAQKIASGADGIIYSLVRQSDAQAKITALEAEIARLRDDLASSKHQNFNAGYLIACCNLFNMHNEEGMAADILSEAGITEADVKALDLSEYDANALAEIRKARSEDPILKGGAA